MRSIDVDSAAGRWTFPLAAILLVSAGMWAWHPVGAIAAEAERPNILFLFTDDQRPDTIHALGNPVIRTPTLDRLAEGGFVFRNAYCFGSNVGAVCLPSRNMLMSGRAYFRWTGPQAPPDGPNFPVAMKKAGYVTYHHGKRGNVALLINETFDTNKYVKDDVDRASGEPGQTIVNEAIDFLKNRPADRPFFMYLAFGNPHDPRVAAKKYLDLYNRNQIPLPKNYLPVHPFDNGEMLVRDEKLAPWPRTREEIRRHLHEHYAVITALDGHIGRLLDSLRELGLYDNTIIIFSSDNGLAIGSHGLMGKQNLYEHSAKVPLMFAGPGIPRGRSDALVYVMDIFPTVCDLVGTETPSGLDGRSFAPVLGGKSASVRDSIFMSYRDVQRGIRDERWKLIRYPKVNITQLFDLRTDPDELHNLADDPQQADRIERMMGRLRTWQKQLGDTAPLEVDQPQDPAFHPPTTLPAQTPRKPKAG